MVALVVLAPIGCGEHAGSTAPLPAKDSGDPRVDRALELIAASRPDEANVLLEEVLDGSPRDARALLYAGVAQQRAQRPAAAIPYFERALALEGGPPEIDQVHHFLGWSLLDLGRLEEARRAFERHLELRPDAADSHFAIGRIDLEEGALDAAAVRFRRAIELDAGNPRRRSQLAKCHVRLADVALLRDRLDEALEELQRAVELDPRMHQAQYRLHRVATRLGREREAADALAAYERWRPR